MELRKFLEEFVNQSYDELVILAAQSFFEFGKRLEEYIPYEQFSSYLLMGYLAASISADKQLTPLEKKFLTEVGGFDEERIEYIFEKGKDPEYVNLIDQIIDLVDSETKAYAITFCCCILAIDETINRDEVLFIEKLLR